MISLAETFFLKKKVLSGKHLAKLQEDFMGKRKYVQRSVSYALYIFIRWFFFQNPFFKRRSLSRRFLENIRENCARFLWMNWDLFRVDRSISYTCKIFDDFSTWKSFLFQKDSSFWRIWKTFNKSIRKSYRKMDMSIETSRTPRKIGCVHRNISYFFFSQKDDFFF